MEKKESLWSIKKKPRKIWRWNFNWMQSVSARGKQSESQSSLSEDGNNSIKSSRERDGNFSSIFFFYNLIGAKKYIFHSISTTVQCSFTRCLVLPKWDLVAIAIPSISFIHPWSVVRDWRCLAMRKWLCTLADTKRLFYSHMAEWEFSRNIYKPYIRIETDFICISTFTARATVEREIHHHISSYR